MTATALDAKNAAAYAMQRVCAGVINAAQKDLDTTAGGNVQMIEGVPESIYDTLTDLQRGIQQDAHNGGDLLEMFEIPTNNVETELIEAIDLMTAAFAIMLREDLSLKNSSPALSMSMMPAMPPPVPFETPDYLPLLMLAPLPMDDDNLFSLIQMQMEEIELALQYVGELVGKPFLLAVNASHVTDEYISSIEVTVAHPSYARCHVGHSRQPRELDSKLSAAHSKFAVDFHERARVRKHTRRQMTNTASTTAYANEHNPRGQQIGDYWANKVTWVETNTYFKLTNLDGTALRNPSYAKTKRHQVTRSVKHSKAREPLFNPSRRNLDTGLPASAPSRFLQNTATAPFNLFTIACLCIETLSNKTSRASVAQLVRARDCQSLGRRFDSG